MAELSRARYCGAQRPDLPRSRGEAMERARRNVRSAAHGLTPLAGVVLFLCPAMQPAFLLPYSCHSACPWRLFRPPST